MLGLLRRDAVREVLAARRERGQAHGLAARDEDDAEPERRRALLEREPALERELEDRREEGQAVGDGVVQEPAVEAHVAPAPGRRAQELGRVEAAHGARVEAPAHEGHVPLRRGEGLDEQDGVGASDGAQEEAREAVRAEAVRLAEGPAPRAEPRELVRVVLLVVLARAALFLDEHGLMSGVRSCTARSRDSKTAALLGQACKVLLVAVEEGRSSAVCSELID